MRLTQSHLQLVGLEHRPSLLDHALALADAGYRVFPLARNSKRPAVKDWEHAATTDPEQVQRWWHADRDANIGLACAPSGVVVVDLDVKGGDDGIANWTALTDGLDLPASVEVVTPSGGRHLIFRAEGFRNSAGTVARGIDVRGHGGFVVAIGSTIDGREYRTGDGTPLPRIDTLPDATEALRPLLVHGKATRAPAAEPTRGGVPTAPDIPVRTQREPLGRAGVEAAFARELEAIRTAPKSAGNDTLNAAAYNIGQLIGANGLDESVARDAITKAARARGRDEAETAKTLDSGLKSGMANPRPVSSTEDEHALQVRHQVEQLRVRHEARRQFDDEQRVDEDNPGRMVAGGEFALDIPDGTPAVWGDGNAVVWAEGEALMLVGPPGVGKTTLANELVRARLGIGSDVLGLPVARTKSKVLYCAMDRPRQIARSFRRGVRPEHRPVLDEHLVFWQGPPPADMASHPETLLEMARQVGADTVIIDSLKDAALGLTEDEVGAGYNRARQLALAAGIEVLEIHHMVKNGANGSKPNNLQSVYGSAWLTAGAGSVVLLWGEAGDSAVEFVHLKQPAEVVGPWQLHHNHAAGTTSVTHGTTTLELLVNSGDKGLTVLALAEFRSDDLPDPASKEKARRELRRLVAEGLAEMTKEDRGGQPVAVFRAAPQARGQVI